MSKGLKFNQLNRAVLGSLLAALPLSSLPLAGQGVRGKTPAGEAALSAQDREVLAWAQECAQECVRIMERWLSSKAVSEERLFSRFYYAVPNTDPPKFHTDYDVLSDKDLSPIQERYLGKSASLVYFILSDANGYVPTHNLRYAQPLTGNHGVDLVNNRTKRIFMDKTGFAAARNTAPYLVQHYLRDTGDQMADLSVPLMLHGRHWGCVRVGYRTSEK